MYFFISIYFLILKWGASLILVKNAPSNRNTIFILRFFNILFFKQIIKN